MAPAEPELLAALERRSRRAYERARWRQAAIGLWPVAVLTAICLYSGVATGRALAVAAAIAVVLALSLHRGGALQRGAHAGLLAGLAPLCIALLGCRLPHLSIAGASFGWCLPGCALAGAGACVWVIRRARAETTHAAAHLGVGLLVAALTGTMGCLGLGLGGLLAMAAGSVLVGAPAWVLARR